MAVDVVADASPRREATARGRRDRSHRDEPCARPSPRGSTAAHQSAVAAPVRPSRTSRCWSAMRWSSTSRTSRVPSVVHIGSLLEPADADGLASIDDRELAAVIERATCRAPTDRAVRVRNAQPRESANDADAATRRSRSPAARATSSSSARRSRRTPTSSAACPTSTSEAGSPNGRCWRSQQLRSSTPATQRCTSALRRAFRCSCIRSASMISRETRLVSSATESARSTMAIMTTPRPSPPGSMP